MKSFLKFTLASIVGLLITSLVMFFIFMGVIGSMVSSSEEKTVEIEPNTILHVTLNAPIKDRSSDNPFENFDIINQTPTNQLGLNDILENIEKAIDDENIAGIYLDLSVVAASTASIQEIRTALAAFKESGKFILCYGDVLSQSAYYLATVADEVFLNPEGMILFSGLSSEVMFYKGALEKLGIEPQLIRHGKFKGAMEPFIREDLSEENREQIKTFINSIWGSVVKEISEGRKINSDQINSIADNLETLEPQVALDKKMVDGLKYKDEIIAELKSRTEVEEDDKLKTVSLSKYTNVPKKRKEEHKGIAKDKVAVIYASGTIVMGKGDKNSIGCDRYAKAIRKARKDDKIKAIVLRVNSGGGNGIASEVIWREIELAKKEKPVIASFGDVAASGGYYIACNADTILASPTTITGSIGVFAFLMNGKELLNDKLGITVDVVKTNENADFGSFSRKMTEAEKVILQREVDGFYETFIGRVADGRGMSTEQVDEIGQGRVWAGTDAMKLGLIDVYGGLEDAIDLAVEKAGLDFFRVVELPEQTSPIEELMKQMTGEASASIIEKELGPSYRYYKSIKQVLEMQGIQARMPFDIEIR